MRVHIIAAVCLLAGCSGGDLTLPESADPSALRIVSGDDQRADAGDLLSQPLVVQVLDAGGGPIPETRVEFGFLEEVPGAAVNPSVVATDAEGRAQAFVRLGTVSGEQLIIARVVGTAAPSLSARFSVVALADGGGGGGKKDDKGKGHGEED